jgi:hypothetical protein
MRNGVNRRLCIRDMKSSRRRSGQGGRSLGEIFGPNLEQLGLVEVRKRGKFTAQIRAQTRTSCGRRESRTLTVQQPHLRSIRLGRVAEALSHPDGSDGIHRVYWIPLFQILEERGFKVYFVNAHSLKTVPGRKSLSVERSRFRELLAPPVGGND